MADRTLRVRITANADSYKSELDRASRMGTNYYRTMESGSKRLNAALASNVSGIERVKSQMISTTTIVKGFIGAFAVSSVIKIADDYGQMAARIRMALKSVEGSTNSYTLIQERLLEVSNRNAKDLADSQELYIRSASALKSLGYSTHQTLDFIESLSSGFTANATSAEKVQSTINALNKSFVSGKIGVEQWRTIIEAMPNLVDELATSMKKDRDEVLSLGSQGKLSMRDFSKAVMGAKDSLNALADGMGNTVADGFTQVSNSFSYLVGELNDSKGITQTLSSGLKLVADNINLVAGAGVTFVGIGMSRYIGGLYTSLRTATTETINNRNALLENANAQVIAVKLLKNKADMEVAAARYEAQRTKGLKAGLIAQNNLTAAIQRQALADENLAKAQLRLNTVTKAGTGLGLLSRAGSSLLGVMGGPVGLITTLGLAAFSFIDFGNSADDAKKPIEELQLPINELIAKFKELDRARQGTIVQGLQDKIANTAKEAKNEISNIQGSLKGALTEFIAPSGIGSIGRTSISEENINAINNYITEIEGLYQKLKEGEISSYDFGNALASANQQLTSTSGGGENLRAVINRITADLLKNAGALDETNKKLSALMILLKKPTIIQQQSGQEKIKRKLINCIKASLIG